VSRVRARLAKALLLLAAALMGGCAGVGVLQAPARSHFVLEDLGRAECASMPAAAVLLVDTLAPAAFYGSPALVFSREPGGRDFYQYARWTERPAARIASLARDRLGAACLYSQVVLGGEGVRGDYLLTLRLRELYHDAAEPPGLARLVLEAQLIERDTARLLAHKQIEAAEPAASYDARGAVAGFNRALTRALDALTLWLAGLPPAAP